MKHFTWLSAGILMLGFGLLNGCSTSSNTIHERGRGVAHVYEGSFEDVWSAVPAAIRSITPGAPKIVENDPKDQLLFASGHGSHRSYAVSYGLSGTLVNNTRGQNALIFVDRIDDTHTKVEVVYETPLPTQALAANWSPEVHRKLSQRLKLAD